MDGLDVIVTVCVGEKVIVGERVCDSVCDSEGEIDVVAVREDVLIWLLLVDCVAVGDGEGVAICDSEVDSEGVPLGLVVDV